LRRESIFPEKRQDMFNRSSFRLCGAVTAALLLVAGTASAQFRPRTLSEPATGERYHIEGSAGFWNPSADMVISSEQLGIPGSNIDFKKDLGLTDQRFNELHVVLRPARKHKLRFQYIPIKYEQGPVNITRDIVFNGQKYSVGSPVVSSLEWKAYRFAYEYDFLSHDRWFGGLILEAKYTDVDASLQTIVAEEFAHAKAPVPAIGGIFRYYVVPNISITGELSGVTIPESASEKYNAHYADLDIYGTLNFTNNVGGQFGYRMFDVGYKVDQDTGSFVLKGFYFGIVARY
jgi:hypothetical protein